jgi:NAD(P)-dependent dehydrogenase (short-subunit alcohol dehydrogenase family)
MGMLEGRVGLVTGAASGIGAATVKLAAREGARVVLADREAEAGEALAKEIRADGGQAVFVRTDVTRAADVEALVARAVAEFGALHWASNNAAGGAGDFASLVDTDDLTWERTLAVCLTGVFYCMKYEVPAMLAAGGGSIVNISSASTLKGHAYLAAYTAAKGGVEALTKTAAQELSVKGIRVNAVSPGGIETPAIARYFRKFPDVRQRTVDSHAMRRLGTPEELAEAVVWLASERASYVTGANLLVDGGSSVNSHML